MTMFMNGGSVAVIALGAVFSARGKSDPETIIAFMQYFTQISMAMMAVTRMFVMYTKCSASAVRISEVLSAHEEIICHSESEYPSIETDAHIVFDKVCFSYTGKKNNTNNISFSLKKGESLGIIGATGSGKSTMVKLLMRFYDVNSGCVTVDGTDIQDITRKSLRKAYTMVLQDTWLFGESIYENIAYGRENASYDDVIKAAKAARIHSFIESLPDGYNTVLTDDGVNISKGQKQLITIARAMLADSEMLILDEATSNVDSRTEIKIREAMAELMKGRTCFVIAHRLSTIQNADVILVVRDGKISEQGTHYELIKQGGFYSTLYNSQFS